MNVAATTSRLAALARPWCHKTRDTNPKTNSILNCLFHYVLLMGAAIFQNRADGMGLPHGTLLPGHG